MNSPAPSTALLVQVEAAPGTAANGNSEPANLLVILTDALTGQAVINLTQKQFTVINHFSVPGQTMGFSNNITFFNNVGTGAYHLQVKPVNDGKWVTGTHLAQLLISAPNRQGQGAATLVIR